MTMSMQSLFLVVVALASLVAFIASMVGVWTLFGIAKQIAATVKGLEMRVDSRLDQLVKTEQDYVALVATNKERERGEEVAATLAASQTEGK